MTTRPIIYQLKISLKDIKPKIWRRIQVPENYSFRDLHFAIQCAMGWAGYHLHLFKMKNPRTGSMDTIGEPSPDFELDIDDKNAKMARYFVAEGTKGNYEYDFGDGWEHEIVLEKIILPDPNVNYPRCVTGKRACPPEDCGGSWGYKELLEILSNAGHEEHKERMEWLEKCGYEDFNPEEFDPNSVHFEKFAF